MQRLLPVLLCLPLMACCETKGETIQNAMSRAAIAQYENDVTCRNQGLREETPAYRACMAAIDTRSDAEDDDW